MKMTFLLRKLFHFHHIADQDILIVVIWFLPFLTAQSFNDNRAKSQCLVSVANCLYKDESNTGSEEPFYLNPMKDIIHEHEEKLSHKLNSIYGNITEHMEELCQPQYVLNSDLKGLVEAVKTINQKLEGLVPSQETTEQNELLAKEELRECKEKLASSQQATAELVECQKSLANAQPDTEQLRECEKIKKAYQDLTHAVKEILEQNNILQRLVRQRYTEEDVVNAAAANDLINLRLLLDAGMSANSRNPKTSNNTPLHPAASQGRLEIIKLLVERGANLEARNANDNTPLLSVAVGAGSIPAAKLLIDLGANPMARGRSGETTRQIAARLGHHALANWLKERGW